ncbi:MAG: hypothetical protein IT222_08995 [Crocinitomix sp.]|nr:hypothetical protein [Crocinitomix sp.]
MKKKQTIILVGLLFLLNNIVFSQDTTFVNDKIEFEGIVKESFDQSASLLNLEIRSQIDTAFKKFNYEGEEYIRSSYLMEFLCTLDSCGFIVGCEASKGNAITGDLISFQKEVASILISSNFQIETKLINGAIPFDFCNPDDCFQSTYISFELTFDPAGIIFLSIEDYIPMVYVYFSDQGPIYFTGFTHGCQ